MILSDTFVARIKAGPTTARELARAAGVSEEWLSRLLGLDRSVRRHDPRLGRLAKHAGFNDPAELFAPGVMVPHAAPRRRA